MKKGAFNERFLLAFAFALLLHFLIIQIMVDGIKGDFNYDKRVIEIEYINPIVANNFFDDESKNLDQNLNKKKEEKKNQDLKEIEKEEEVKKEEGQIVYIGETESNRAPEKYRFLSEYNSVVEKETKSRYADNKYKNPAPRPQTGEDITKQLKMSENKGKRPSPDLIIKNDSQKGLDREDNKNDNNLALKLPKILKSESINLKESVSGDIKNKSKTEEIKGRDNEFQFGSILDKGEEIHKKRLSELFPQDIFTGKYSGGPFNDWLKDVEESDATFLNAKEYKYATFFNRVKKSISQYWNPSSVILKYDPYGNVYGNKDRLTIVKVKIDASGNLKDVDISQSSGVEFLDRVAIDAFKSAQPFPNPPKGLIDKNGEITFNFGFYIEFSKSSLRLFRYE